MNHKIAWIARWLSLGLCFVSASAFAEGFRNPPPGAFNLGRAGGRFAHVDDSSAVHHNPANLVYLEKAEAQVTPSIVYMAVEHEGPTGLKAETENPWKFLPNFFASMPIKNDRIAAGIGFTAPYGLSVEWDRHSESFESPFGLRYQAPNFTELKTINANPVASFRLNDRLSVGAGLNVMWSEVTFEQNYPWLVFPGSVGTERDGSLKAKGDGFGYGGNLGITFQVTENQRAALSYRSAMDVDYEGDFKISNITPIAALIGVTRHSDFATTLNFPNIIGFGYGVEVNDRFRIEANVEWVQFSRFESLDLDVENNSILFPSTEINQDWDDTFTAGIAGDYRIDEHWIVRGGYQFYQSPVPDETLSPTIPDANQHVLTVGIAYKSGRHSFEAAYGLDFYEHRDIDNNQNPAFNGEYDINVHLFALAYRLQF